MNKQICEDSLWLGTAGHIHTQYCWYSQLLQIFLSLFPVLLRSVETLNNICSRKDSLPSQQFWLPTLNAPLQLRGRKANWLLGKSWSSLGAMWKWNNHPCGKEKLEVCKNAWHHQEKPKGNLEELIQWKFKSYSLWKHKLLKQCVLKSC